MNALYNDNGNLVKNAWKNIDNHKRFAELLGVKLGYREPKHWYDISHKDIKNNKGGGLLAGYYRDSPILFVKTVVKTIYPEYEWLDWNFKKTPQGYWDNVENQRKFMNWLGKELQYATKEDWYKLNIDTIRLYNIGGLLSKYSSSHIALLKAVYPTYEWFDWRFKQVSTGFWQDKDNHKKYAVWLGNELKYTKTDDWYNVTQDIIKDNNGSGMLEYYQGSPLKFLIAVYPEYKWLEWMFKHTSNGFWQDKNNHKKYADWLGGVLEFTEMGNWYNVTHSIIHSNFGGGLLASYYEDSPIQFLRAVYPEHEWLEWQFGMSSTGFWQEIDNHKKYAEWLGGALGYKEPEHWYNVTQNIIHDNCGCGMLGNYYDGSPMRFLIAVYPDYDWLAWKFISTPTGFWQETDNHKKYAAWLGKELKYTKTDNWYNVTQDIINKNCGCGMLGNYYDGSPMRFLIAVYPDYDWLAWKFISTPNGFWQDNYNHKKYAKWLGGLLGYTKPDDWYNITTNLICANYGCGILHNYSSYTEIPKLVYPDYNWDNSKFYFHKTEAKLYKIIISLYCTIITQFAPEWIKPKRYDFCIPELKIIIELDGRQHFQQVSNWSPPEAQFENDKYKETCANENGYSVIRILQEDVLNDTYDWLKALSETIAELKNGDEIANVYLCKQGEYDKF